jgi:hypothetical protein
VERIPGIYTLAFVQCALPYEQLLDFVQSRMKVSHICQPVMHLALIRVGGWCSIREIAQSILLHSSRLRLATASDWEAHYDEESFRNGRIWPLTPP